MRLKYELAVVRLNRFLTSATFDTLVAVALGLLGVAMCVAAVNGMPVRQ